MGTVRYYFFMANGAEDAVAKRGIFQSMLGLTAFKLLSNLVAPTEPGSKTYKELMDSLTEHHSPAQHLRFYTRDRQTRESVWIFAAELHSLAVHCSFKDSLNKMLQDSLGGGINNVQMSHVYSKRRS